MTEPHPFDGAPDLPPQSPGATPDLPPQSPGTVPASHPPVTASMLVYAWADKVAPAAAKGRPEKAVPCAGPDVMVDRNALAAILVHVAFWDLARRGRIRFQQHDRKVLFRTQHDTLVLPADGASPDPEVRDSLEFDLLRSAIALRGDGSVGAVISNTYRRDVRDPFVTMIAMANVAMIAAGLVELREEERTGLARLRGKKETLVWQCARVDQVVGEFNAFVHEWVRDRDADRPAFDAFRKLVVDGIEGRRRHTDDDDDDDDDW